VIAQIDDLLSGRFGEPSGYKRMNEACAGRSEQLEADPGRSSAMPTPAHAERTRMFGEQPSQS
jgi:hypothetical protein